VILIRRIATTSFLVATLAFLACGDYPIFTEMATNRLRVVLKGTFESNAPKAWGAISTTPDDSVDDYTGGIPSLPTEFMLDIAEMRLQGGGDSDSFGFYRQTYRFDLTDSDPFFDGTGVEFDCDDPYSGYLYTTLHVYIRKMILDNARAFRYEGSGTWSELETPDVIFQEETVPGFDFNQLQYNTYWDTLTEAGDDTLRIFPLSIVIPNGFIFNRRDEETVLEVRLVVKNFLEWFEFDYISEGYSNIIHHWALSDWLRNVRNDEPVMGGNIIAVVRSYVPGKTATISGASAPDANKYIVAIESTDDINKYKITSTDRPATCDTVKPPNVVAAGDIESLLDYFIQFEKYRSEYNDFIEDCLADDFVYGSEWTEYNDRVSAFRIPSLVTRSVAVSGAYSLTNVPVGKTYKIYTHSAADPVNGSLPGQYDKHLGDVTIPDDGAGQTFGP